MSRLRRGILVPVTAAAIVVALAACAPPMHPGAHPSHRHTHTSTPTSTPTPAATRPALADLVLSVQGLGPLHLGAPVPATPAPLALVAWDPAKCVSAETGVVAGAANAGAWSATYPDAVGPVSEDPRAPFILTTVGDAQTGNITLVWVWTAGIHTAPGITIGSTLDQLNAAYPAFSRTINGAVSNVYVMDAPTGSLLFEVSAQVGSDAYWPAGQVNKVLWMGAVAPGTDIRPIAASDGGPSTCPSGA